MSIAGTGSDPFKPHDLTTPARNYSSSLVTYDKKLVLSILREGLYCHIGYYDQEFKRVRVVPRQYGLDATALALYLHGPPMIFGGNHSSRLYHAIGSGVEDVCVTVSLVDGLGVGRAAQNGTLHYRSVVIYGKARVVTDDAEVARALNLFADHVVAPGYAKYSRPAREGERGSVGVIRIDFEHVSAKVRTGEPRPGTGDDLADKWAGSVPITQVYGPARRASYIDTEIRVPEFVKDLVRNGRRGLEVPAPSHPRAADEEHQDDAPL